MALVGREIQLVVGDRAGDFVHMFSGIPSLFFQLRGLISLLLFSFLLSSSSPFFNYQLHRLSPFISFFVFASFSFFVLGHLLVIGDPLFVGVLPFCCSSPVHITCSMEFVPQFKCALSQLCHGIQLLPLRGPVGLHLARRTSRRTGMMTLVER